MDREEKIKENRNKIYGIVFGQCAPSLQSAPKGVRNYEKNPKDCDFFWIMEELKKIMTGVDVKANPRLSLIEHLILFVTMPQGPTEKNY